VRPELALERSSVAPFKAAVPVTFVVLTLKPLMATM
jgi:hypothetical protein